MLCGQNCVKIYLWWSKLAKQLEHIVNTGSSQMHSETICRPGIKYKLCALPYTGKKKVVKKKISEKTQIFFSVF